MHAYDFLVKKNIIENLRSCTHDPNNNVIIMYLILVSRSRDAYDIMQLLLCCNM